MADDTISSSEATGAYQQPKSQRKPSKGKKRQGTKKARVIAAVKQERAAKGTPPTADSISPQPQSLRELSAAASLAKLQLQQGVLPAGSDSTSHQSNQKQDQLPGTTSSNSSNINSQTIAGSTTTTGAISDPSQPPLSSGVGAGERASNSGLQALSGAAAAVSRMNDPSSQSFGTTPASQRQLLSALLTEGIVSNNGVNNNTAPMPSMDGLPPLDRAQALGTVNRALQEQLILGELLRQSPNAAAVAAMTNNAQTMPFHLLHQQQQQAQQQMIQNTGPRGLPTTMALGMLPSPSMDMMLPQPKLNLLGSSISSLQGVIGAPPLFSKKKEEESNKLGQDSKEEGKDESNQINKTEEEKHEERQRMLPPRKRRKMVNFKLDTDFPQHSANNSKITFPLPRQAAKSKGEDAQDSTSRNGIPALTSYKKLWSNLEKISGDSARQEMFRRRLSRGKVFILKKEDSSS